MTNTEYLTLAGVPIVLSPPAKQTLSAPLILLWHGFGLPNSEEKNNILGSSQSRLNIFGLPSQKSPNNA